MCKCDPTRTGCLECIEDVINSPRHYTNSNAKCRTCSTTIEQIDITRHMGFLEGNVIKYVWRYKHKNGIEDLKKARFYLQALIDQIDV